MGGGGEWGEAGEQQIRAPGNPYSSFSSSSSSLCIRRGFDKKILLLAVPYSQANICHYVFLPMNEYAIKIIPCLLSVR